MIRFKQLQKKALPLHKVELHHFVEPFMRQPVTLSPAELIVACFMLYCSGAAPAQQHQCNVVKPGHSRQVNLVVFADKTGKTLQAVT